MEGQKYILIMTLLVKDEEDIIEENLKFHHLMGVDGFIVTDNNSTDKTPEILKKYKEKGWILEIIEEKATGYEQKKWVHRMIKIAKNKYKAKWIINADADEFWYTPSGCLKNEAKFFGNIIRVPMINVFPEDGKNWKEYENTIRPVPENVAKELGLSEFHIYRKIKYKVMHRTLGYLQIHMGNHKVSMFPPVFRKSNLVLYHYCYRGKDHFERKVINGGKELLAHSTKRGGTHWRYYYNVWLEGKLEGEYNNVVGITQQEELVNSGYIVKDNPLPEIFNKGYETN